MFACVLSFDFDFMVTSPLRDFLFTVPQHENEADNAFSIGCRLAFSNFLIFMSRTEKKT